MGVIKDEEEEDCWDIDMDFVCYVSEESSSVVSFLRR